MKKEIKLFDLDSMDHNKSTVEGLVRSAGKWISENQDKKDKYNIVLMRTLEGEIHFNQKDHFLTTIHEVIKNWPKDQVFLVMSDANLEKNLNDWFKGAGSSIPPVVPVSHPLALLKRTQLYANNKNIKQPKLHHNISSRFICLNAAAKPHRAKMVNQLISSKQDQFGIISWLNRYGVLPSNFYKDMTFKGKEMLIDFDNNSIDQAHNQDVLPNQYHYAGFEIVNESIVSDTSLFITEKTWKPLFYHKVFLPHGPKGMITYLKELGFELFEEELGLTYSDWDNLSYNERWIGLLKDLETLMSMTVEDWQMFYERPDILLALNKNSTLARTINVPQWTDKINE
jgi:hypothetical protein